MSYDLNDFEQDVIKQSADKPVLVDFWAPWCGPCKMLAPALEELAGKADGKWAFVKVNVDEKPELASQYGVRGIPNVKLFKAGEVADEFTGVRPADQIESWLAPHLS